MSRSPPSSPSEGGGGEGEEIGGGDASPPRPGHPSSSRARSADAVWPEHFVEAVAAQVAVDAARAGGRLAAAPAIATVFKVCSTWRAVSRSELLWQDVTRRVWSPRYPPSLPSWRHEFCRLHRTALNLRTRHATHSRLLPPSAPLNCRRLALSHHHLAAGFIDGSVRLFLLPSTLHVATYGPHASPVRLGLFSQSIAGIFFLDDPLTFVYASQDGDIHVATIGDPVPRRAHAGNLVEDGTLVDFVGDSRWWVGLFAGAPGRSLHVWDARTEQLVHVGGLLTDPDSVIGWRLLTETPALAVGRVRIAGHGTAVGCTGSKIQAVDLSENPGEIVADLEVRASVDSMDAAEGRALVVDKRGMARVLIARNLEEVCRFSTVGRRGEQQQQQQQQQSGPMVGCMNWGYAMVCTGGEIRVWDADTGVFLYRFRERVGEVSIITASDTYVAAWADDTGLHLWDFGDL